MPHSSGGGSHGGGSHGGSSSHSSGGGGGRARRTSNSYFVGARRYVYYRNNQPKYVYADYDITEKKSPLRYLVLLFYVPFIFGIAAALFDTAINVPKKLVNADSNIVIEDRIDVLDDMQEIALKNTLKEFYDKTGVTPAVITVYNEDWYDKYSNLTNYAFDLYVNKFVDEKHWLIVYSQPVYSDSDFIDWYWEGMQGDYTDNIITTKVADRFTGDLQRNLLMNSKFSVAQAIDLSFQEIMPNIMDTSVDFEQLFVLIIAAGFVVLHACVMVGFSPKQKYYEKAKLCPANVIEAKCDYCSGIYVVGTCTSCPHCGAPIKPREQ